MKNRNFLRVGLLVTLLGTSLIMGSCGDDEEPTPNNQIQPNPNPDPEPNPDPNKPVDQDKLVSELKCTVDEFATKYTTLKKGEKVTVTLTDVSDANIAKVSETLKKMSADPISKAGEAKYIVTLILESISNALKTIPADTFKGVEVLREVVIPACVEAIQSDAFAECVNLVSAKILGADTKVDEKAFESANEEIKVEQTQKEVVEVQLLSPADIVPYVNASNEEIVTLNMALDTYDHTEVLMAIDKITDKKVKLVIPEGVKELAVDYGKLPSDDNVGLIYEPIALVDVVIPDGVTQIGKGAFLNCSSLTSITIPEGVNAIGPDAFYDCSSLTSITIPESVTSIGLWAFWNCSSLTSITIPESVTEIGYQAFDNCDNLETIYCSQAIYDEYHKEYPQMVVKGGVSGNVNVDDLEFGKDIK